jgi:hypothetical protein
MSRYVGTVQGKFTKEKLEGILGEPSWEWEETKLEEGIKGDCELSTGGKGWTAGWGSFSACCRIFIHPEGICIHGGMDVPEDRKYARQVLHRIIKGVESNG